MAVPLQVIGHQYNKLLVIEEVPPIKKYIRRFNCLCTCGRCCIVQLSNLRSGHTTSCGCYKKEMGGSYNLIHGMSNSTEYKSYKKMIERCYNHNDISYKNYGLRGISVCEKWRNSFSVFFNDMGLKPTPYHSLDRIDSNGDYCKENCKWSTRHEQNKNRRNNIWIEHNGFRMILKEWAAFFGTDYRNIKSMMKKKSFSDVYNFYEIKKNKIIKCINFDVNLIK